jgi:hypothetical protein
VAGVRGGVEPLGLAPVARLAQDDRTAARLTDQTRRELPRHVAVRAPVVHPPAVR